MRNFHVPFKTLDSIRNIWIQFDLIIEQKWFHWNYYTSSRIFKRANKRSM